MVARWYLLILAGALLVVAACAAPAASPTTAPPKADASAQKEAAKPAPVAKEPAKEAAQPAAKGDLRTVKITMSRGMNFIGLWGIESFLAKYGMKPEFVVQGTNAEMQQRIQTGQADVGALGYQSPAILADQGVPNVKVIAGIYNGGQNLIVRKAAEPKSWKDLEGKKIGRAPGTYANILFTLAAGVNGVDLGKVNIVDTTAGGTTELQALKNGDLDGFLLWSPIIDKAVVDGYGAYPACCDIGGTKEFGAGNQILGANADFLKDRQTAVNFLKAYVESIEYYQKNQDKALGIAVEVSGADQAAVQEGFKHAKWEYRLDRATALNVGKQGTKFGFTKTDASAKTADYFDFSYLAEATGKSVEQLSSFSQ